MSVGYLPILTDLHDFFSFEIPTDDTAEAVEGDKLSNVQFITVDSEDIVRVDQVGSSNTTTPSEIVGNQGWS